MLPPNTDLLMPYSDWEPISELPDLSQAKTIAVDLETCDPHLKEHGPGWATGDGFVAGIAFCTDYGLRAYLPIGHANGTNLDRECVLAWARSELGRENQLKVCHNATYDVGWLRRAGVVVKGPVADTQLLASLLDENRRQRKQTYTLDELGKDYLGEQKDESLLRDAARSAGVDPKAEMYKLPPEFVGAYAEQDAALTLKLLERFNGLIDDQGLRAVADMENALIPVSLQMRWAGVRVDIEKAQRLLKAWKIQESWALATIDTMFDTGAADRLEIPTTRQLLDGDGSFCTIERSLKINIWSNKDLAKLFDRFGLPYPRTEKGAPSFEKEFLGSCQHPVAQAVATAKRINKGMMYVQEQILGNADSQGRIHPSWNQLVDDDYGTISGRYSCSRPNFQQMPKRDPEVGPYVRSLFLPEEGARWASFDYCYSADTEILTKRGFVPFPQLGEDDWVAQWDNGTISYVRPEARTRYVYRGDMVQITGAKSCDLLVTPSHRCLLQSGNGTPIEVEAKDYPIKSGLRHVRAGSLDFSDEGIELSSDQITVLCAVQADATLRIGRSGDRCTVRIKLRKQRKIERLLAALDRLQVGYRRHYWDGFSWLSWRHEETPWVWRYLSWKKEFDSYLRLLTEPCRRLFLEELLEWDGSRKSRAYATTVQRNADLVQEIATISGVRSKLSVQSGTTKPCYLVYLGHRAWSYAKEYTKIDVPYHGYVYCVTVPSGWVVVRRNGLVSVCGNSQQEPRLTVHYACIMDLEGADEAARFYREDPNADYHTIVATMAGISRTAAKEFNLGLAYGMGKGKLGKKLGLSEAETDVLWSAYHERLPYIRSITGAASRKASSDGFVRTILGRRCRFDLWEPKRSYEERQRDPVAPQVREIAEKFWPNRALVRAYTYRAFNRVIQGSAADQTKKAMLDCGAMPMAQVHDELCFSVDTDQQIHRIKEAMTHSVELVVPTRVDVSIGESWGG